MGGSNGIARCFVLLFYAVLVLSDKICENRRRGEKWGLHKIRGSHESRELPNRSNADDVGIKRPTR